MIYQKNFNLIKARKIYFHLQTDKLILNRLFLKIFHLINYILINIEKKMIKNKMVNRKNS